MLQLWVTAIGVKSEVLPDPAGSKCRASDIGATVGLQRTRDYTHRNALVHFGQSQAVLRLGLRLGETQAVSKAVSSFGYPPSQHENTCEDILDPAERTCKFITCFIALSFTERVKGQRHSLV